MPERQMSDEHKAAIAAGRVEAGAVSDYLEALEGNKPKRRHRMSAEQLAERRAGIDAQIAAGGVKPIKRLEMLQTRRDIDTQFAALADEPDMTSVEAEFVTHAASYGTRKGITYATWREAGVPAELLGRAGISRGQWSAPRQFKPSSGRFAVEPQ